jgi:hypothetical protein
LRESIFLVTYFSLLTSITYLDRLAARGRSDWFTLPQAK